MPGQKGYVDQLVSSFAVDYSKRVREGLVGAKLFPRTMVGKPSGKYAYFGREAYVVPNTALAGNGGRARLINDQGEQKDYATEAFGLAKPIDIEDLQYKEGPFAMEEKKAVEQIVSKIEIDQERRIANLVLSVNGQNATLSGTGAAATNQWGGNGGDPFEAINDAIKQCFWRPNAMVIPESVFDVLEFHSGLIGKLGENNLVKQVTEKTLAQLFRLDMVLIAKGRASLDKKKASGNVTVSQIWGNNLVLAYVSEDQDSPRAGTTFTVKDPDADGEGYIVRKWVDEAAGVKGAQMVQCVMRAQEKVVSPQLIYAIKSVI